MTPISDEAKLPRTLAALTELGRDGARRPTRAELDHGLNLLLARLGAGQSRRMGPARWALVAAVAILSTLLVVHLTSLARKASTATVPALAYQVEGGKVLDGGYLRESGHTGMKLVFNEGSTFSLTSKTRGRLRVVNDEGVRVAIDNGTASFQVTPSNHRRWWVEAGPFLVTVKGTVFDVTWEPSNERFELRLRQGSVVVSGPVSGGDLTLRAGQRLLVNLGNSETLIAEERAGDAVVEAAAAPNPSVVTPSAPQSASALPKPALPPSMPAPSAVANTEGERRWAQELASGHWDRILEEVDRSGVEVALNGASSEDLFALANAARYRRRVDLAREALLAQRRRFPNSPRAIDALYLLGRVEESQGNGMARAIARYDDYLARAPTGSYAAEALGRKMIATKELSGAAQARSIAEEYLRRFPKGSYAGTARALLRAP